MSPFGTPLDELWSILEVGNITLESYGVDEALRRPLHQVPDQVWKRLAPDALIAGHLTPGDELWTKDAADFVAVGVPREQIHAI